jgi:hypothetical protein
MAFELLLKALFALLWISNDSQKTDSNQFFQVAQQTKPEHLQKENNERPRHLLRGFKE